MLSISISMTMPDLDREPIEVPCPRCDLHTWVTLSEIRRRDYAVCRGCHANILLEDHLGSMHRIIRDTESILRSLGG
jgi:hypothetical protein